MKIDKHLLEEHNHMRKLMNLPLLSEQDIKIGQNQKISLECVSYNEKGEKGGNMAINGQIQTEMREQNKVPYFIVQRPKSINDGPWSGGGDSGGQSYNVFIEPIVEDSLIAQLGEYEAGNKILSHWPRNNSRLPKHYCEVIKDGTSAEFIQELVKNGVTV